MRARQLLRVEAGQRRHAQQLVQLAQAQLGVELPGRAVDDRHCALAHRDRRPFGRYEDLRRRQARQP
jgi:hypothetical protein